MSATALLRTIALSTAMTTSAANAEETPADTIYINGNIYTVNAEQPWVEAVAIRGGVFIEVSDNESVAKLRGAKTRVIDLDNQFAMPGIIDTHIHPSLLMAKRSYCALPGTFHEPSERQIMDALEQCIEDYPADKPWFIAQGYTTPAMSSETLTRKVLDTLIPDRPAWIEDESGHNAWFNTKAMELAGVDKSFQDTPEEFFSRTNDGELAGVAFEGAMNPFLDVLPEFKTEDLKVAFARLLDEANSKGITSFGDAYVFENDLQAWHELNTEDKINAHAVMYLKGNLGTAELTPVSDLLGYYDKYDLPGHPGVKLGMGGAIESYSEALVDGYQDSTKSARPIIDADAFAAYIKELDDAGFQVKVHAIGDGTVRATLDGYEQVIKASGSNKQRHHIDHCSLVHPDDFKRFVELDVTCTIWPPLNAPVAYNVNYIKPAIKPETWNRMYANRDMYDAGIKLTNHTDAPAAVLWPWWGMEAALTRGFPGQPEKGSMHKQQALTVKELIEIYTINSAWSLHLEKTTGSIEVGKSADMIVLNHNLFEIDPTSVHQTKVKTTLFAGNVVYQAEPGKESK
ncbi:MAG: amidohydrolase [Halioglobus sp.]